MRTLTLLIFLILSPFLQAESNQKYSLQSKYESSVRLSEKGDTNAMHYLYKVYRYGKGQDIDTRIAFNYLKKAAANGNPKSIFELARAYEIGVKQLEPYSFGNIFIEKNSSTAIKLYRNLIDKYPDLDNEDNLDVLLFFARAYDKGFKDIIKVDPLRAYKIYEQAFNIAKRNSIDGDSDAAFILASMYAYGNPAVLKNTERAYLIYQELVKKGHYESKIEMAQIYYGGFLNSLSGYQDILKAVTLYEELAREGDIDAQSQLGFIYQHEQFSLVDDSKAVHWLRKAIAQDPTRDDDLEDLGDIQIRHGNYSEALDLYLESVSSKQHPNTFRQNNLINQLVGIFAGETPAYTYVLEARTPLADYFQSLDTDTRKLYQSKLIHVMREVAGQVGHFKESDKGRERTINTLISVYENGWLDIKKDSGRANYYREKLGKQ